MIKTRILIEPLLFGDYFVAVYDERDNLVLDHKYRTKGFLSARMTALELRDDKESSFYGLEIYYIKMEEPFEEKLWVGEITKIEKHVKRNREEN